MAEGRDFDVAVIGGGIWGTILAAILARNGVQVVCLEGGSHPRFAIGEATVPDSSSSSTWTRQSSSSSRSVR